MKNAMLQAAARTMNEAGFDITAMEMDLPSRESIRNLISDEQKYGEINRGIAPDSAGVEWEKRRARLSNVAPAPQTKSPMPLSCP